MNSISKITVTVITGFLGAGKTTFINFLLKKYPEKQFALVENEFGEISIDTKLIKGVDASRMFELKKGCICCTISDEYELVLQELAGRFPNVEHLIIETTGIADPAPVIRPFFRDENLRRIYRFAGTVCLVDASNFSIQPEKEILWKQIAVADFILINKSEQLSVLGKENIKAEINRLNPLGKILFAEFGFSSQFQLGDVIFVPKFYPDFVFTTTTHSEISTKYITFFKPLKKEDFEHWLSYILDIYKTEIYRVKGILCFENEAFEFILQAVGGNFEIAESEKIISEIKSEVVFIGKLDNLNLEVLF